MIFFEDFTRQQWNQTDQGPNAQRDDLAVHVQLVIVEAVVISPQSRPSKLIHRVRDRDEVLEILGRHVLVCRIALCQF